MIRRLASRLSAFLAWHAALVIGTTREDGTPGDEIHVYSGHIEIKPAKERR